MTRPCQVAARALLALLLVPIAPTPAPAQTPPEGQGQAPGQHQTHEGHPPDAAADAKVARTPGGERDLPSFIPVLTDEDRRAAFPEVGGHAAHDRSVHAYVLFDRIELQTDGDEARAAIDTHGWIGRDRDRLWFRSEGDGDGGGVDEARASVWYGRQIARWWDVVAGGRQDFTGANRTWASAGIQGLAPYWFHVETTLSVGAGGRTHLRADVRYELLLTNRLVLQPTFEAEAYGKSDAEERVGAGLSHTDVGLRLRYELRRDVAPYAGVVWNRSWGGTADRARAAGEKAGRTALVAGLRFWF